MHIVVLAAGFGAAAAPYAFTRGGPDKPHFVELGQRVLADAAL